MADITQTSLTSGGSTTDGTGFTTASITPTANKTVILAVSARAGPGPTTIVGNTLTWTKIIETADGLLSVWRGTGAVPTTGTIAITFAGSQTACVWSVFELTNDDTSAPIVQSPENSGSAASGSVTMAAFGDTANATIGVFSHNANEVHTPGSGFTEIHDTGQTLSSISIETEFRLDNDTSVDASWATSTLWRAVGMEIKNATPAGGATFVAQVMVF